MPEGDTIFRAARTLHRALAGRLVTRFTSVLPHVTRVHEDTPVTGRRIDAVEACGKHLLMSFSGELVLRTHMRMHGSWHIYRVGERWQRPRRSMRIVVATDMYEAVAFDVPVAELVGRAALARHPSMMALGPDLLSEAFDEREALARLRDRQAWALADALLDQRALAGIGNAFKSEICFACRLHPATPVGRLSDEQVLAVLQTARDQLRANVPDPAAPGLVAWHGRRRTTGFADPRASLWVYGRGGQACRRCGARIASGALGERPRLTYWCPVCQPTPPPSAAAAG